MVRSGILMAAMLAEVHQGNHRMATSSSGIACEIPRKLRIFDLEVKQDLNRLQMGRGEEALWQKEHSTLRRE